VYDSIGGKYWITLFNSEGLRVECGLLVPTPCKTKNKSNAQKIITTAHKKYPAIILLGGKTTGKYAIDYAMDLDSIIIFALDYPYEPRQVYTFWTILYDIPVIRSALINMVPSTMLAIDYLINRSDVDSTKIVLLGYSFGAPFVPVLSTLDRRIDVATMVYGGGDLTSLIRHNVRRYEGVFLSEFVGQVGGLFLRPIEPMRYAEKISPTPLFMINGTDDEQVPRRNTDIFFREAKEPKKIVWLESKHVHPKNQDLTRRIIASLKQQLKDLKVLD